LSAHCGMAPRKQAVRSCIGPFPPRLSVLRKPPTVSVNQAKGRMGFLEPALSLVQGKVLLIDSILTSSLALFLYFAPDVVGDFLFRKKTDGVHWHLIRCVGGQLLATAFVNHRLRNSSAIARSVCFLIRIVSGIITLMLIYQCQSQTPMLIEPQTLEYARVASFGIAGVYLVLLICNGWPIGDKFFAENRLGNFLYQLDCLASICIGLAWLTFPQWLLHKQVNVTMDESHEFFGRLMGAYFVSTFCISQHALHWPSEKDRKVVVESRAVCCAAILIAQLWSQKAYHDDWTGNHWVGIMLFSIWTFLACMYTIIAYVPGSKALRAKKSN
ncbi:hypothetical protein PFISCL1PPCAC_25735, partial [Pristionchus fissidentatus]